MGSRPPTPDPAASPVSDPESPATPAGFEPGRAVERVGELPSGRRIALLADGDREQLEVRSADGRIELRVVLTDAGPVVSLSGAKLELHSTDSVSVRCRSFEVEALDDLRLRAAGDIELGSESQIRARAAGQAFIDGDYVNLNCRDRTGYHDEADWLARIESGELEAPALEPGARAALPDPEAKR